MLTDVAIVTATNDGQIVNGCAVYLRSPSLPGGFLFDITVKDGYALFKNVQVPFEGTLKMTGACQPYEQAVSIPNKVNVTIRVGHAGGTNPQDVQLEGCVPFV